MMENPYEVPLTMEAAACSLDNLLRKSEYVLIARLKDGVKIVSNRPKLETEALLNEVKAIIVKAKT